MADHPPQENAEPYRKIKKHIETDIMRQERLVFNIQRAASEFGLQMLIWHRYWLKTIVRKRCRNIWDKKSMCSKKAAQLFPLSTSTAGGIWTWKHPAHKHVEMSVTKKCSGKGCSTLPPFNEHCWWNLDLETTEAESSPAGGSPKLLSPNLDIGIYLNYKWF